MVDVIPNFLLKQVDNADVLVDGVFLVFERKSANILIPGNVSYYMLVKWGA